jgi:flagellar motor switch protein FliG
MTMGLMPNHGPGNGLGPMTDITPATMTRRQKAAVIVRLLLLHGVSPGIDRLSPAHQSVLARAMSGLGQIDRATLADIVGEFTGALDNLALIMPRGMHDALEILNPHISAMARDGLRADAEIGDGTDPWPRLAAMDVAQLRPILDDESAEICAILLSKLSVAKAAALLSDLPPTGPRSSPMPCRSPIRSHRKPPCGSANTCTPRSSQSPRRPSTPAPWTASARC